MNRRPRLIAAALATAFASSLCAGSVCADPVRSFFERANESFFAGNYAAAIASYEFLVESGIEDPGVHFNLGVAHARNGALGRALFHFERALMLAPDDLEAERGRQECLAALGRRRAEAEGEVTLVTAPSLSRVVASRLTDNQLAVTVLALDAIVFLLLGVRMISSGPRIRRATALAAGVGALALSVILGLWLARSGAFDAGDDALVLLDDVPLREGPSERAQPIGALREGDRVVVTSRDGRFLRVELDARRGWVRANDVGVLR